MWQPGLTSGEPDRLLGRPVVISDYVPTIAAFAKVIAFGDFSYYWIADRQVELFSAATCILRRWSLTGH